MPDSLRGKFDAAFEWWNLVVNHMLTVALIGMAGIFLVIGLWPSPLRMQPGSLPFNQVMVRAAALTTSAVSVGLIKLMLLLMRKRNKYRGNSAGSNDPEGGNGEQSR